jgi:hypothetical protein
MEKVKVVIEGVAPLLQHRFPIEENNKSKKKKKEYIPQEDAEKSLYRDEKGVIYEPATHIFGALIKAGIRFQYEKRQTYSNIIKSSVLVTPDAIPHKIQKWIIDSRPVVVMRARILRSRPKFEKWGLEFIIEYDDELIGKDRMKEILDYAGLRIGLGDYRPLFGRFIVTKFENI